MTATQKSIATLGALLVVGGGIYYFSTRPQVPASSGTATTTPTNTIASTTTSKTIVGSAGNNVKPSIVTPDYKKPIAFSASVSADIRTQLNTELKTVQSQIAQNPLNIKPWVDLGTLHKMGGDYANAAMYWEYIADTYTGSVVPYYSLGDLYENFLHDTTKAEVNYKLAIQTDPTNINAYADLYTMYHYTLKDDTKAAAILAQGLKANPGNNYLLGLQSDLQAGK